MCASSPKDSVLIGPSNFLCADFSQLYLESTESQNCVYSVGHAIMNETLG